MKKKTRTITVNNKKYIWWYEISRKLTAIIVSPFEDKTSTVRIYFTDIDNNREWQGGYEFNLGVMVFGDGEEYNLKLIEPKMVSLLISYLEDTKVVFAARQHIEINGFKLLEDMGYIIIRVEKGIGF